MAQQDNLLNSGLEAADFMSQPLGPQRRLRPVPIPGESLFVPHPEIAEVMATETGEYMPVAQVIGSDYYAGQLVFQRKTATRHHRNLYDGAFGCSLKN